MFRRSILPAAVLGFAALAASPAHADRCDDIANQLKNGIDGLSIGKTAAGVIYLSQPQAKALTLGCSAKNYSNQLYASTDRKPKPAYLDVVAGAAAIIFTLPKDNMLTGVKRCMGKLNLFRSDASLRYRRLDMRCTRSKTDSSITISRDKDQ
jgi:hypothetical protein